MNVDPALGKCPDCGSGVAPASDGKWGVCIKCGQRLGDCYGVAAVFVFRHDGWTLVHGTLLKPSGERIYHAWAEKGDTVWQGQLGRAKAIRRSKWYRSVDSVQGWYARPLAVVLYQLTERWGPWHDDEVERARASLADLKANGLALIANINGKDYRVEP